MCRSVDFIVNFNNLFCVGCYKCIRVYYSWNVFVEEVNNVVLFVKLRSWTYFLKLVEFSITVNFCFIVSDLKVGKIFINKIVFGLLG